VVLSFGFDPVRERGISSRTKRGNLIRHGGRARSHVNLARPSHAQRATPWIL
jgi:hypothetical protein